MASLGGCDGGRSAEYRRLPPMNVGYVLVSDQLCMFVSGRLWRWRLPLGGCGGVLVWWLLYGSRRAWVFPDLGWAQIWLGLVWISVFLGGF